MEYKSLVTALRPGMRYSRNDLIKKFISINYNRNDTELTRDHFRVRGDTVEIMPASSNTAKPPCRNSGATIPEAAITI